MEKNIFDIANRCISPHLIERYFRTEKAYWKNGEYWTLNPLRPDSHIGSFSISESGLYSDFASGDNGNFIDLIAKHFRIEKKEAAEKIINDSGGIIPDIDKSKKDERRENPEYKKKEKKEFYGQIISDKKREVELKPLFIEKANADYNLKDKQGNQYKLVKIYTYRQYKTGFLLYYIARYESLDFKNDRLKKFSPFSLGIDGKIYQKLSDNFKPFPLYKINETIGNELPVIIVEGEKCADIKLDNYRLVTFNGGAGNINNYDFTTLRKKIVYIWPDNDEPGKEAAQKIKKKIPKAEIFDISILGKPEKWDIADAARDNENIEEIIIKLIAEIEKKNVESIRYDSEHAAEIFLKKRFNNLNLDQVDGIFWRYKEDEHYWDRIEFANIRSDIQIFLKKNGYFKQMEIEKKKKITFKNDVVSFIKDYSQKYFKENPFIESTIMPYIHFKNGVIKIEDEGYKFFSRDEKDEDFFRKLYPLFCFDFNFRKELEDKVNITNIDKKAPLFHYFIKSIVPEENIKEINLTIQFVCQMIAYCMSPKKKRPYFFAFYGDEDTAKTSLFELVKTFIGDKFTVRRSIKEIEDSRFGTSDLWGAKIFADDDMDDNALLPGGFIKRLSGETTVTVERKHENSQKGVKLSIAMFFVSNFKLKAYGIEGIKRRAIIVQFQNKVPKKADGDLMRRIAGEKPHNYLTPEYEGKTFDEREIIIHLIMQEWNNMAENNHRISLPEWVQKSTDSILSDMTSSIEYLQAASNGERFEIVTEKAYSIEDIYKDYKDWCKDEGRQPKSKSRFEEEIRRDKTRIDNSARLADKRKGVYRILFVSSEVEKDDDLNIPF